MADTTGPADAAAEPKRPKSGIMTILIALVAALALGGAAFYGVYSGLVPLPGLAPADEDGNAVAGPAPLAPPPREAVAPVFVALEPMVISLGPEAGPKHLRFSAVIEVAPDAAESVAAVSPRIADVLNTFLRAVEPATLEEPRLMSRLRAQMLRRVQLVAPDGAVRDLLIQEFVLN